MVRCPPMGVFLHQPQTQDSNARCWAGESSSKDIPLVGEYPAFRVAESSLGELERCTTAPAVKALGMLYDATERVWKRRWRGAVVEGAERKVMMDLRLRSNESED